MTEKHPFDAFFEEHGYADGEEPQAFADWLASLTGKRQVGMSVRGRRRRAPEAVTRRDFYRPPPHWGLWLIGLAVFAAGLVWIWK